MKIKFKLTLGGGLNPADSSAEFELTGNAWTANTRKLAESAGDASCDDDGKRSVTRRLANIDPALVDDFRRTL